MNRLEELIKQVGTWWTSTSLNQKIIIVLSSVVGLVVSIALLVWAAQPDYTILFSKLNPQDANAIVEHLKEVNVPYRLSGGGSIVEIPSKSIYDVRIELAGKGLPKGDGVGYEIFDKMSFGVTDEVQEINLLRALQNELEHTIDAIDVIQKSRVHLVIPKDEGWFQQRVEPTASVMVRLATGGTLLPNQISSIRHLLASAVSGLQPEGVTIVDTHGKVLSAAGDSSGQGKLSDKQIDYKEKVEKALIAKAESLLFEIVGQDKAAVQVYAEVDFDQIVRENEYFTPVVGRNGLVRSEKSQSVTPVKDATTTGGAAGTASNLQGYPPAGARGRTAAKKNERQINYEMNRTVERITTATGRIKKLSVGIFIDGDMKTEQLDVIRSVVAKALGIDKERGDELEVQALPFYQKTTEQDQQLLEKSQREKFIMTIVTKWGPRVLLVVIAVSFLFMTMNNMKKMAVASAQPVDSGQSDQDGAGNQFDPNRFIDVLKRNPDETAKVLKNWMS